MTRECLKCAKVPRVPKVLGRFADGEVIGNQMTKPDYSTQCSYSAVTNSYLSV